MTSRYRSALPAGWPGAGARRAHRRAAAVLMLAALAVGQGCYAYHPTELARLRPNEEIRVVLREEGYRRVAPGAAEQSPQELEGRFVRTTPDSVGLSVWIGGAYRGTPFESAYQYFTVPRVDVLRVENRQLSAWRTAVVAVGAAAVIAGLIKGVRLLENGGGDSGGTPPYPPASPSSLLTVGGGAR